MSEFLNTKLPLNAAYPQLEDYRDQKLQNVQDVPCPPDSCIVKLLRLEPISRHIDAYELEPILDAACVIICLIFCVIQIIAYMYF